VAMVIVEQGSMTARQCGDYHGEGKLLLTGECCAL